MNVVSAIGIAGAGIGVGVFSALFGVGGGIIMVPFMTLVLDKGQHLAEGTSLLVIVPTAIVGALAHRRAGYI
ncbi:MAG: TSUP family transporter, partial [Gammaproteobacteria bacterium]